MDKIVLAETTKDPNVLDELSQDEECWVRWNVASNLNTKPETLDVLSMDENTYVRCLVAENPNCSERAYKYIKGLEILESLSEVST